jgi:adenylate kinase family enzyme
LKLFKIVETILNRKNKNKMECSLLTELITDISSKEIIQNVFISCEDLILKLNKLNNLIGMDKIKTYIAEKIRYYIVQEIKNKGKGLEGNKIHFIILGNPGTGKTTVCKIISEIYNSIGFLRKEKKVDKIRNITELQNEIIQKLEKDKKEKNKIIHDMNRIIEKFGSLETLITPVKKSVFSSNMENKDMVLTSIVEMSRTINVNLNDYLLLKKNYIESLTSKSFSVNLDPTTDIFGSNKKVDDENENFLILGRADFVGQYVGSTENKIEERLREGLGGVIFIDEFYSICVDKPGHSDSDGIKILNRINSFIDEYNGRVCFAFGGYLKDIENQIFKKQAGLESRICDKYIIEDYTCKELALIYIQKMEKNGFLQDVTEKTNFLDEIVGIVEANKSMFSGNGRSMETLADATRSIISNKNYDLIKRGKEEIINFKMVYLKEAITSLASKNI